MLIIDEYRELIALETFFRRLGFDVLSIGKDLLLNDALLRFHPDLVMSSHKGRMVDGMKVASRLRHLTPSPRVVLVIHSGSAIAIDKEQEQSIDAVIEFPAPADKIITVVAKLLGLDDQPLIVKYRKQATVKNQVETSIFVQEEDPALRVARSVASAAAAAPAAVAKVDKDAKEAKESWTPQTNRGRASEVRTERTDRYTKFLQANAADDVSKVLPQKQAHQAMQALKTASESERAKLDQLDHEKRAFAKALFTDEASAQSSQTPKKI